MAIQVGSSVHAAVTMFTTKPEPTGPLQFLQSPQGCILQRVRDDASNTNAWLVLLDYGLDVGSTAFSCVTFGSLDPLTTRDLNPPVPVLFHIDDRVKLLALIGTVNGEPTTLDQSFHALFVNYQANQQELYPVDLVPVPPLPPSAPGPIL